MVWNSLGGMKPYGAAYPVPTPEAESEPTTEPTTEPSPVSDADGDFLTDGNNLYGKMYRPLGVEKCGAVIFSHGFSGGATNSLLIASFSPKTVTHHSRLSLPADRIKCRVRADKQRKCQ